MATKKNLLTDKIKSMIYNGINFYEASVKGKTEKEFIEHEKHHKLSEDQLKEVYSRMTVKPVLEGMDVPVVDQPLANEDGKNTDTVFNEELAPKKELNEGKITSASKNYKSAETIGNKA